jgi:S1-C subfamily serine protease
VPQQTQWTVGPPHLCVFILASLVGGCVTGIPTQPTDAVRAQSLQHVQFDATALASAATKRCAVIVTGAYIQSIAGSDRDSNSITLNINGRPNSVVTGGLAVAVDKHGYFLTAAHTTDDASLNVVFFDGQRLRAEPVRIVAKLSNSEKQFESKVDIALLHVAAELPEIFEWADETQLHVNDPFFEIGSMSRVLSETNLLVEPAYLGGALHKVIKLRTGGAIFKTDLPTRRGDSGGPLLNTKGQLVGVLCGIKQRVLGRRYSFADRPNLDWLRNAIEVDQRRSHDFAQRTYVSSSDSVQITIHLAPPPTNK